MRRGAIIEVGEIAAMLSARIESLARELLPHGRREGHEWVVGSVAGEAGKSLAVHLGNAKAGVWRDFAADIGGDALDLIGAVRFGGDKGRAVAWAKSWLGLDDGDPERLASVRAATPPRPDDADIAAEEAAKRDSALRIFRGGKAGAFAGSLAERYLRGRGIDLAALGRVPGALGFSNRVWCKEAEAHLPAMLASIQIGGEFVGVHRTWLDPATGGKARLLNAKKTLGRWRGGVIPLWRPAGAARWADLWAEGAAAEPLIVTEGIENGLSVAMARPGVRVVAAVSLKGIAAMALPPAIAEFTIAADNDAHPREQAALMAAIEGHRRAGRTVKVARAPAPHKDFNDWLQALAGDGPRQAATGGRT